jgi:hypothetical protein
MILVDDFTDQTLPELHRSVAHDAERVNAFATEMTTVIYKII